jgi:hypothetical protein
VIEAVFARMEKGEFLREIEKEEGFPSSDVIRARIRNSPELQARYARVRLEQSHAHAERAIVEARAATPLTAQSQRLKYDAERWMAGKLNPRAYADKLLHTGADGEGPVQFAVTLNYAALDEDELMTLRRLLAKCSVQQSQARLIEGQATEVASDD